MFYTEEDLKQAYVMGYNEAVDDVNTYIESCDEEYDNDEDYSAVEAAIMNETKSVNKDKHADAMNREITKYAKRDGGPGDYSAALKYTDNDSDQDRIHKQAINNAIRHYKTHDIRNVFNGHYDRKVNRRIRV